MGSGDGYRINEPTVIHQTIGGETVIIHLTSGLYYSLEGCGAEIWERLSGSDASVDAVAADLGGRFPADLGRIAEDVPAFVARLVEEDLLVPRPASDHAAASPGAPAGAAGPALPGALSLAAAPADPPATYQSPRVARYDDLQDLLLLDPIHAVDEAGWPERPQTPAGIASSAG